MLRRRVSGDSVPEKEKGGTPHTAEFQKTLSQLHPLIVVRKRASLPVLASVWRVRLIVMQTHIPSVTFPLARLTEPRESRLTHLGSCCNFSLAKCVFKDESSAITCLMNRRRMQRTTCRGLPLHMSQCFIRDFDANCEWTALNNWCVTQIKRFLRACPDTRKRPM